MKGTGTAGQGSGSGGGGGLLPHLHLCGRDDGLFDVHLHTNVRTLCLRAALSSGSLQDQTLSCRLVTSLRSD